MCSSDLGAHAGLGYAVANIDGGGPSLRYDINSDGGSHLEFGFNIGNHFQWESWRIGLTAGWLWWYQAMDYRDAARGDTLYPDDNRASYHGDGPVIAATIGFRL